MFGFVSIQCPNCDGYKVVSDEVGCLDIALMIITGGLWLLRAYANRNQPPKSGEKLRCDICGYRWVHQE